MQIGQRQSPHVLTVCAVIAALLSAAPLRAQPSPRAPTSAQRNLLCSTIERKGLDEDDNSPHTYLYERVLWDIVGADPAHDSIPSMRSRVQAMWNAHYAMFRCTTTGLTEGSVLRYALKKDFIEFLDDLVRNYRININVVDPADSMTVLDWACDQWRQATGSEVQRIARTLAELKQLGAEPAPGRPSCLK
jgi:hypothetical protein